MNEITYRGRDGWALRATIVGADLASDGSLIVLIHAGGPDHHSLLPLAQHLSGLGTMALPDVRGYGRSLCVDPARHTWTQYADDVVALLDHLGRQRATLIGVGIGTTISLRVCAAYPDRIRAAVLISVEDIENDEQKLLETELLDAFAHRVRTEGLEAAWAPILAAMPPVVDAMVRDAIPRSDPASIAAAAFIGRDRSFRSVEELAGILTPVLVVPGIDTRHPTALAEQVAATLPAGRLATVSMTDDLNTADEFAIAFAPAIRDFLATVRREGC